MENPKVLKNQKKLNKRQKKSSLTPSGEVASKKLSIETGKKTPSKQEPKSRKQSGQKNNSVHIQVTEEDLSITSPLKIQHE